MRKPSSHPLSHLSTTSPGKGDTPTSNTLEILLEKLSDDNEGIRWNAAEALGRLGDLRAVEPLIDTLWDDDARVRVKAAWALGILGDPRALPPLQKLYRMEREDSRDIIEEAMDMIKRAMAEKMA